ETSEGSRSGVNWMRRHCPRTDAARARARVVLPTPGTSSSRTCPWANSAVRASRTTSGLPSTTVPIRSASCSATWAKPVTYDGGSGSGVTGSSSAFRQVLQVGVVVAAVEVEPGQGDVGLPLVVDLDPGGAALVVVVDERVHLL